MDQHRTIYPPVTHDQIQVEGTFVYMSFNISKKEKSSNY